MTERLKVYVHPATGIVYIDRGASGHATAFPAGRCLVHSRPLDANELAGLVELVEKPAEPLQVEPEQVRDRQGLVWLLRGNRYHLATCTDDCPKGVPYAALVYHYSPLTEVTD